MSNFKDQNSNSIPDILEGMEFIDGEILTAETMNDILSAIKGTYDILTQKPQLNYADMDGYREGEIKEWSSGDEMVLYFDFTSSVYGKVTTTIIQINETTGSQMSKTITTEQGRISVSFGKTPKEFARYQYIVSAVDANGRTADKTLTFTQIAGGFEFSTELDTVIQNKFFVCNKDIELNIPYIFNYMGSEASPVKTLECTLEKDGYQIVLYPQTAVEANKGNLEIKITKDQINSGGTAKMTIKAEVLNEAETEILRTATQDTLLYFSESENNIIILSDFIPSENLNTDSKITVPFKVSWFKNWENLTLYVRGELIDCATESVLSNKTSKELITINNEIYEYKINGFPYHVDINKTYKIKLTIEGIGANANIPQYSNFESEEFIVIPGTGIEFVITRHNENILLANFDAKSNRNNSDNPNEWTPTHGSQKDNWKINLYNLACVTPNEDIGETWDTVGSGWKEYEYENECNYLHLKHNAYGILTNKNNEPIELSGILKQGCSLEVFIKTDYLSNIKGHNLSCLNSNQNYGFVITPQRIGSLANLSLLDQNAQQQNVLTTLDNEWLHVVFTISIEDKNSNISTTPTVLNELEDFLPTDSTYMTMYVNGVMVKISDAKKATLQGLNSCYLLLNNLLNQNNTGYESNTKFQYMRLYNCPLLPSEVRQNYRSCLSEQKKDEFDKRNSTEALVIPKVIFTAKKDSKNAFEEGGVYNINTFTPDDKGQPKLKEYVSCTMQFTDTNGETDIQNNVQVTVQGTSSLGYPVKNYKIKIYEDEEYKTKFKAYRPSPKLNEWKGDYCYTLKCDYMEHSHKNNTPTAKFYNEVLLPEILGENDGSPARQREYNDAIDGFPVLVYYQDKTKGAPKYIGTYMFNTDKSGLDQGFELPLSEEKQTLNIPYYNDSGEEIQCEFKTKKIPCISYEGGSNINYSAATFLPYEDYKQQQEISPSSDMEIFNNKYKYYNNSLEPRFNSFEDEADIPEGATWFPLERSINWLNQIWPTLYTEEQLNQKSLINDEIKNKLNWLYNTTSSSIDNLENEIIFTNNIQDNLSFIYNLPKENNKLHSIYMKLQVSQIQLSENAAWILQIIDIDHNTILLSQNITSANTYEYNCGTNQAQHLQIKFTTSNNKGNPAILGIQTNNLEILQKGPVLLQQNLPSLEDVITNGNIEVGEGENSLEKFQEEFSQYFNFEYCLAYYLQALVFTQADNIGKNAMFDTWFIDGEWTPLYPRPYDMDSQMGLNNQGQDIILASAEITPLLSPNPKEKEAANYHRRYVNQYAVTFSKLWLLFGHIFKDNIAIKYKELRNNIYNLDKIKENIEPLTTQSIGELYYNADAVSKYLYDKNRWLMLAGNRTQRFYSFLQQRLEFLDTYFLLDDIKNKYHIEIRSSSAKADVRFETSIPSYITSIEDAEYNPQCFYCDITTSPKITLTAAGPNKNIDLRFTKHLVGMPGITNLPLETFKLYNCDDFQKVQLNNQANLSELELTKQNYLKNLLLQNCSSLSSIGYPESSANLVEYIEQDMPTTGTLNFTNSGLIKLDITGTKYDTIKITNAPIQEIIVGKYSAVNTLELDNCYSLSHLFDNSFNSEGVFEQCYPNLQTLTINKCNKLEEIEILKCKASTISITNCPNLKKLSLTESDSITTLDLTGLTELTELNLSDCVNLTTIYLPNDHGIKIFNLHGCEKLEIIGNINTEQYTYDFLNKQNIVTSLQLYNNLLVQYIKNLTYKGRGYHTTTEKGTFEQCEELISFENSKITFLISAPQCFKGCKKLDGTTNKNLTSLFNTSPEIYNLREAFSGCNLIKYKSLYALAKACPNAYNFYGYWWGNNGIASNRPASNYGSDTWPDEVKTNGFFAIYDQEQKTYKARIVPTDKEFDIGMLFYYNPNLNGEFPSNFFKNLPTVSLKRSLSAMFAKTRITKFDLDAFITATQPQFLNCMFKDCTELSSLGFNTENRERKDYAVVEAKGMFYGCSSLDQDALIALQSFSNLENGKYMFAGTGITTLKDKIDTPLFSYNKNLKHIDGMFAECNSLSTIPSTLFNNPQSEEANIITHENLTSIAGLFAKNLDENVVKLNLKDENISNNFFAGANIQDLGTGKVNNDEWPINIGECITPGGAFCGAEILSNNLIKIIDLVKNTVTSFKETFKNTTGFSEINLSLKNCPNLNNVYGMFRNSSITMITNSDLLFAQNNNQIITTSAMFMNSQLQNTQNINLNACTQNKDISYMFANCYNLVNSFLSELQLTTLIENTSYMFANCINLGLLTEDELNTEINSNPIQIKNIINKDIFSQAANLTNTSYMFSNCYSLYGKIPEDLFKYNFKLSNISYMFNNCYSLRGMIPIMFAIPTESSEKYSDLKNIEYLFAGCSFLTEPFNRTQGTNSIVPENFLALCPNIIYANNCFMNVGNGLTPFTTQLQDNDKQHIANNQKTNYLFGAQYTKTQINASNSVYSNSLKQYKLFNQLQRLIDDEIDAENLQPIDINGDIFDNQYSLINIQECFAGVGNIRFANMQKFCIKSLNTLNNAIGCFINTNIAGLSTVSVDSLPFYSSTINHNLKLIALFSKDDSSLNYVSTNIGNEYAKQFTNKITSCFYYGVIAEANNLYKTPIHDALSYEATGSDGRPIKIQFPQLEYNGNSTSGSYLLQYYTKTSGNIVTSTTNINLFNKLMTNN